MANKEQTTDELRRWLGFIGAVAARTAPQYSPDSFLKENRAVIKLATQYALDDAPVLSIAPPTLPEMVAKVDALGDRLGKLEEHVGKMQGDAPKSKVRR